MKNTNHSVARLFFVVLAALVPSAGFAASVFIEVANYNLPNNSGYPVFEFSADVQGGDEGDAQFASLAIIEADLIFQGVDSATYELNLASALLLGRTQAKFTWIHGVEPQSVVFTDFQENQNSFWCTDAECIGQTPNTLDVNPPLGTDIVLDVTDPTNPEGSGLPPYLAKGEAPKCNSKYTPLRKMGNGNRGYQFSAPLLSPMKCDCEGGNRCKKDDTAGADEIPVNIRDRDHPGTAPVPGHTFAGSNFGSYNSATGRYVANENTPSQEQAVINTMNEAIANGTAEVRTTNGSDRFVLIQTCIEMTVCSK